MANPLEHLKDEPNFTLVLLNLGWEEDPEPSAKWPKRRVIDLPGGNTKNPLVGYPPTGEWTQHFEFELGGGSSSSDPTWYKFWLTIDGKKYFVNPLDGVVPGGRLHLSPDTETKWSMHFANPDTDRYYRIHIKGDDGIELYWTLTSAESKTNVTLEPDNQGPPGPGPQKWVYPYN